MLGRAVQLTFPVQSPQEELLTDSCTAKHYLDMCLHPSDDSLKTLDEIRRENANGTYLWGDYRKLILKPPPDLRLMNLETALTRTIDNNDIPWGKGINYHFHLSNFEGVMKGYRGVCHLCEGDTTCSCQPSPVCVTLANNHIMDYGKRAFEEETLPYLTSYAHQHHTTKFAGAGTNIREASRPAHWTLSVPPADDATMEQNQKQRTTTDVYVIAAGSGDSGVSINWAATLDSAGVFWLPRLDSMNAVDDSIEMLKQWMAWHAIDTASLETTNSIVILSIHWGPNWAYRYHGDNQKFRREFAHKCIDECGVDAIYGHSSHHIRGLEKYNGKLIIYGAGDLINDYEGFANAGDEKYCEFGALFLADIRTDTKELHRLTLVPTIMNRLQLKLLCPSSKGYMDVWNPRTKTNERHNHFENASTLCNAINELTKLDADRKHMLPLHVMKDPICRDSEFVLGFP